MKIKYILLLAVTVSCIIGFFGGSVYGMNHIDYDDPNWECKKWVGMVELAKQDFPHFVNDTLTMAENKCGFDVRSLKS